MWFEPNPLSLYVQPSHLGDDPVADQRVGFTWHVYCGTSELTGSGGPDCALEEQRGVANGVANGRKLGASLLLGEFGNTDDPQRLNEMTALADGHVISWAYWTYKSFSDQVPKGSMFTDETDLATLKPGRADALIRPYPHAVAGTPLSVRFDPDTRGFHFAYRPGSRERTEISVPKRQYPHGYRVTVAAPRSTSPSSLRSADQLRALSVLRLHQQ